MSSKVFLLGMPGSGKSTIAGKIANRLGIACFDLDLLIEQAEGLPVSEIFQRKGEDYFRRKESDLLKNVCMNERNGFVLACGGGTPCFFNNMDWMLQQGICVYLEANSDFLYSRISQSDARPMFSELNEEEKKAKLKLLLEAREKDYQRSHLTFSALHIDVEQVVVQIKNHFLYTQ